MNVDLNTLLGSCRGRDPKYPYVEGPVPFYKMASGNHGYIRLDPAECKYIARVARLSQVGILEVGRYLGGSTVVLAYATQNNYNSPVVSVDIGPLDDDTLREVLVGCEFDMDLIDLRIDDSHNCDYGDQMFDFAFIDGDHTYEGVLADLQNCWDNLTAGAHIICHDIHDDNYQINEAICDFLIDKKVLMHIPPFHIDREKYGTLCHFQKIS